MLMHPICEELEIKKLESRAGAFVIKGFVIALHYKTDVEYC